MSPLLMIDLVRSIEADLQRQARRQSLVRFVKPERGGR
jgi:hypothetical protein